MTYKALIRFAPLLTAERVNDEKWQRTGRTLYNSGALTILSGHTAPVLADHEHEIGVVRSLMRFDDTDGPWLCAIAQLEDPPGWVKRGVRASFGYKAALTNNNFLGRCEVVHQAMLTEVSLLRDREPAEPGAHLMSLKPDEAKPSRSVAAVGPSGRAAAAGDRVFYGDGRVIRRLGIGQVVGIR